MEEDEIRECKVTGDCHSSGSDMGPGSGNAISQKSDSYVWEYSGIKGS